jgi:hypothetical protein
VAHGGEVLWLGEKLKEAGGKLAHHHDSGLETAWAMGKQRWRRSMPTAELRWRRVLLGPVGDEGPWARDPRAGGAGGEGGREEADEVLTDDEELRAAGNGVAAGLHGGGACGEGVGGTGE